MADLSVTTDDLASFLGITWSDLDSARATLLLQLARDTASSVVSPLPASARGIVLTIAARAYTNVQGVTAETIGPYSVQRPAAGLYLTKAEKTQLKSLAGRGGAFSIDPTPVDAGSGLSPWDLNVTYLDGVPLLTDGDLT